MRVVHYLNQFFGGLGGEEKAGAPLECARRCDRTGKLSGATPRRRCQSCRDVDLRR